MGFIKNVATTGLLAAQAVGLSPTATAADPAAPKKPTTTVTSVEPKTVSDLFAARVEAENTKDVVMVTTQGGKVLPKPEYFDLVTKNAVRDGIFKNQDQFTQRDMSGGLIPDQGAYRKYMEQILGRAEQFKDPKTYGMLTNSLRYLTGQKEYPRILTQSQLEALTERYPINESMNVIGVLSGMLQRNKPIEAIKANADRLMRLIEEEGTLRNDKGIEFIDYTK